MQHTMHLFLDSWVRGGHMMDMGRGFWFFPGLLWGLLPLLALILLVIWAIRGWSNNRQTPVTAGAGQSSWQTGAAAVPTPPPTRTTTPVVETPLDALQMRYAKGEISRAEYDTIRQDILRDRDINSAAVVAAPEPPVITGAPPASAETSGEAIPAAPIAAQENATDAGAPNKPSD